MGSDMRLNQKQQRERHRFNLSTLYIAVKSSIREFTLRIPVYGLHLPRTRDELNLIALSKPKTGHHKGFYFFRANRNRLATGIIRLSDMC